MKLRSYILESSIPKKGEYLELGSIDNYKIVPIVKVDRQNKTIGIDKEDLSGNKVIILMIMFCFPYPFSILTPSNIMYISKIH
jgi:hypothetical protein